MGDISQALGSAGVGQVWPVGTAGGRLAGRRKRGARFSLLWSCLSLVPFRFQGLLPETLQLRGGSQRLAFADLWVVLPFPV